MRPIAILAVLLLAVSASAAELTVGIMQDQKGAAEKYAPLKEWLAGKGVAIQLAGIANYAEAAKRFQAGGVDAMFSGSGLAGALMIKQQASPLVRPVKKDGVSTYSAVVLAKAGAAPFTGDAKTFAGKTVMATALASSGEFFVRSLVGGKPDGFTLKVAPNHGVAIDALANGQADYAVVKNRVWDANKAKYPTLAAIGQDAGENPDNTLMVAAKADAAAAKALGDALLALEADASPAAQKAKDTLGITSFIATSAKDFAHTVELLGKAGIAADTDLTTFGK